MFGDSHYISLCFSTSKSTRLRTHDTATCIQTCIGPAYTWRPRRFLSGLHARRRGVPFSNGSSARLPFPRHHRRLQNLTLGKAVYPIWPGLALLGFLHFLCWRVMDTLMIMTVFCIIILFFFC